MDKPTVTQGDRELFIYLLGFDAVSDERSFGRILRGEFDDLEKMQRIACHRTAEVERLREVLREANETIIAFAAPWAAQYARDFGLPDGHLHPTHYDILEKAGRRMDAFTRAALGEP